MIPTRSNSPYKWVCQTCGNYDAPSQDEALASDLLTPASKIRPYVPPCVQKDAMGRTLPAQTKFLGQTAPQKMPGQFSGEGLIPRNSPMYPRAGQVSWFNEMPSDDMNPISEQPNYTATDGPFNRAGAYPVGTIPPSAYFSTMMANNTPIMYSWCKPECRSCSKECMNNPDPTGRATCIWLCNSRPGCAPCNVDFHWGN
jgi:hypothetical protein